MADTNEELEVFRERQLEKSYSEQTPIIEP